MQPTEPILERITGPFHGSYFLAAYAVRADMSFHGYAKICSSRPSDVWACHAFSKVATPLPTHSPEEALDGAERRGRALIRQIALGLG